MSDKKRATFYPFVSLEDAMKDQTTQAPIDRQGEECRRCGDCQQPYTPWYADNPLWNAVMRAGDESPEPFLCSRCFLIRAEPVLPRGVGRVTVARDWRPEHNTEDLGLVTDKDA